MVYFFYPSDAWLHRSKPEIVEMPYEPVNKSNEDVDEAYEDSLDVSMPDMTKERYEVLIDKEKVEWLGIAECSVQDVIQRFITKLDSIGVVYRYSDFCYVYASIIIDRRKAWVMSKSKYSFGG